MSSIYEGTVILKAGSQLQNISGTQNDNRSGGLSWINFWSLWANDPTICDVCPLVHGKLDPSKPVAGTFNICRSVGGHVEIPDDGEGRWFIVPICFYHNGQKDTVFNLATDVKAVQIEALLRLDATAVGAERKYDFGVSQPPPEPGYQRIYMGWDKDGKDVWQDVYECDE